MGIIRILKREYEYLDNYHTDRKFRKVIRPFVSDLITSEDSSVHWKYLDVAGKAVLDLGCGLWEVKNIQEASPVYFKNKGAKKIIGIDQSESDIGVLKKYFGEHFPADGSEFLVKSIRTTKDITELITQYQVESIKCDIEGFEKVLFGIEKDGLKNVINISVEYHNRQLLLGLLQTFKKRRFTIINHSVFTYAPQTMGVITAQRD
ncbi:MAG TPA: hypothetical protein VG367_05795 [Mucilaginibacter sp.]|jgi:hypothetical protein|nr:hypothetical protein [Mucilaginibacter sp.]